MVARTVQRQHLKMPNCPSAAALSPLVEWFGGLGARARARARG